MAVSGDWTLFYNWGCSGAYSTASLTFHSDGTFTVDSFSGQWSQTNCQVILRFKGDSAIYAGVVNGGAIVGNEVNFSLGASGCFYATKGKGAVAVASAIQSGAKKTAAAATAGAAQLDPTGRPPKATKKK